MRNSEKWKPTHFVFDAQKNRFVINYDAYYAGSRHIAGLQFEAYQPLFKKYSHGKLLDCGCGPVPFFEMLREDVTLHYCIDRSDDASIHPLLDEVVDLNRPFQLKEQDFDCVLLTDVLAHVQEPAQLIKTLASHLKSDGTIIITTPFVYWIAAFGHEYYHPTEFALKKMCNDAGLEILQLTSYGGYPDVLLDTLNKGMIGKVSRRVFRLLASVVKKTSWYKKTNEKTKYTYPLGYTLAARKL